MRNRTTVIAFLAFVLLGSSLREAAYAQEKRQWRFIETKDAMTDKVTALVVVGAKNIGSANATNFTLSVGSDNAKGHVVFIAMPMDITPGTISLQWRVDDLLMVEESWIAVKRAIITSNNDLLMKRMLTGTTLKVRLTAGGETTPILEYDITGLSDYLPKLGIGTTVGARQSSINDVSGGWKAYDQLDENGKHVRALVIQGIVVGSADKAAVMMLHQRQDGSWSVGFGLSIKGYTSPITTRGDDFEPIDTLWKMTPDKGGTNAVLPLRDDKEFLRDLQTTKVFELTYPRHPDMAKIVLRFDVRGLSIALKKLETERDR